MELAHRSVDDLDSHFEWYKRLLELGEKKKYAITQWRKQKDKEREALKSRAVKSEIGACYAGIGDDLYKL